MPNDLGQRSTSEIMQDVVRDLGEIVQGEMRLARAELVESARQAGKAGGMFGGAAVCGLLAGGCLAGCIVAGLALVMPVWLAALLTSVLFLCIAGAMYAGGRAKL